MMHGTSKEKRHELVKIDDFLSFFSIIYCHTMETDIDKNILLYQKEEKFSILKCDCES